MQTIKNGASVEWKNEKNKKQRGVVLNFGRATKNPWNVYFVISDCKVLEIHADRLREVK